MLVVLRGVQNLSFFPKNFKTLLGTLRVVKTNDVAPGSYYGFNLIDQVTCSLKSCSFRFGGAETILKMYVGCDGMPSSKSSNSQFWPLLGKLKLDGADPFEIGLYHGNLKPNDSNDFLSHFFTEMSNAIENGFNYQVTLVKIRIEAFCCDAPAMSFIKKV